MGATTSVKVAKKRSLKKGSRGRSERLRVLDPLGLELGTVVCHLSLMLGNELKSSAKDARVLSPRALSVV